jgi:sarcosine oxidase, subunit gamma
MVEQSSKAERRHVFHDLAGPSDTFSGADTATFAMRRVGPAQRWSLRMAEAEAAARGVTAGFDIGQSINELRAVTGANGSSRTPDLLSARLGPDEWLLIADGAAGDTLAATLAEDLDGTGYTLVDVSHRNIAVELVGSRAADVINTGCPLDLSERAFPIGSATRTLFAKSEVILMRCSDLEQAPRFRIECWRSFGRYLNGLLTDSAQLLGVSR